MLAKGADDVQNSGTKPKNPNAGVYRGIVNPPTVPKGKDMGGTAPKVNNTKPTTTKTKSGGSSTPAAEPVAVPQFSYGDYTTPTYNQSQNVTNAYNNLQAALANKPGEYQQSQTVTDAYNRLQEALANKPGNYQQSQAVTDAYNKLQETLAKKPGEFSSAYREQLDNLYNQIANREKFSYDFNKDAMYQMYKDMYVKQGQQAMKDTLGQASAMTGGYNSSYAQTAGQQTYQNYLQQLNEVIPTLRNYAKEEYDSEGNRLNNLYSLADSMYGKDWEKYRADVSDWESERNFNQSAYDTERNFDWNQYRATISDWENNRDFLKSMFESERGFDWDKYRATVSDWESERDFLESVFNSERDFDWNQFLQNRNFDYDKYVNDKNFAWQQYLASLR